MKKSLILLTAFLAVSACAVLKPAIKTANDLAYDLCVAENAKVGMSAEDIGKAFCATEIALKPFLDAILSAKAKLHATSSSAESSVTVIPPPPACPSAAPAMSVKPAAPAVSAAPAKPAPSASAPKATKK